MRGTSFWAAGLAALVGCATGGEGGEGPTTFGPVPTTGQPMTSGADDDDGAPTSTSGVGMTDDGSSGGIDTDGPATGDSTDGPSDSSGGGGPAVCGDGVVEGTEACDDMGESATCNADCTLAACGDAIVNAAALEECDDGGETATCDVDCTLPSCGDALVNAAAGEACDDGNADDGDACAGCQAASCGDGFLYAGVETCDDGNLVDLDACTNACTAGSILVAGNANTYLVQSMSALGELFTSNVLQWGTPQSAGVIILGRDGGTDAPVSYQAHLDAGAHLLMVGGSNSDPYATWIGNYVTTTGNLGWHQSSACVSDFIKGAAHPLTDLLPATYEFANASSSYHMIHFAAAQPAGTDLLATTCEGAANILVTRRYPSGGTYTYLAFDLGNYTGAGTPTDFLEPFLEGYLAYIRSPAP